MSDVARGTHAQARILQGVVPVDDRAAHRRGDAGAIPSAAVVFNVAPLPNAHYVFEDRVGDEESGFVDGWVVRGTSVYYRLHAHGVRPDDRVEKRVDQWKCRVVPPCPQANGAWGHQSRN